MDRRTIGVLVLLLGCGGGGSGSEPGPGPPSTGGAGGSRDAARPTPSTPGLDAGMTMGAGGAGGTTPPGTGGAGGAGGSGGAGGAGGAGGGGGGMPPDGGSPAAPDAGSTPGTDGGAAPAPAMFSNPAAVKVPTFPDRTCPVAAGTSTAAINAAIARCSGMGGGVVSFAPGTYTVGSIHLKSNVKLALGGATLRNGGGIDPPEPYTVPIRCQDEGHSAWHNAMFWGENLTNVAIVGPGTLDGGGLDGELQKMIAIKSSTGLLFENLTQRNTGHFGYLLTDCHHITMSRLTIRPTRDGVNLMQCTNVNAHDLNITGGPDDAFALKSDCSLGKALPTENITVRDSSFSASIANAIQIGSETWGNFENISWSNIRILGGAKSGIGIQMNDGAVIRNLSYDNITLTNTSFPIFISVTGLLRGTTKTPGHAENIRIRNVTASNIVAGNNPSPQNSAVVISGAPGIPHQGIVLENVKITFPGGGRPSGDPPEGTALRGDLAYNPRFITPMPAYGVFARHVKGLELRDVRLGFGATEQRPAFIGRDVDGLVFDKFEAQKGGGPTLELEDVKSLTIQASPPLPNTSVGAVSKMVF